MRKADSIHRSKDTRDYHELFNDENLLHQDILLWAIKRKDDKKDFDLTEIGNWLIDNHRPFKEEFANSHIPRSYRLHSKRNYIQSRIDDLVESDFIEAEGSRKSQKNSSQKSVYSFNDIGYYFAWLIEAKNSSGNKRSESIKKLLQFVSARVVYGDPEASVLNVQSNSMSVLLSKIVSKCETEGIFEDLEENLDILLSFIPKPGQYRTLRQFIFLIPQYLKMVVESLGEINKALQTLVLFQIKLDIERDISMYSSKDWEIMRYNNIHDYENVTLEGLCEQCCLMSQFRLGIFKFLELPNPKAVNKEEVPILQLLDCPKCKNKDSLMLIPTWYGSLYETPLVYAHKESN